MQHLLEGLNSAQEQAVLHADGPLMIIAGAGTGKTTVITRRIAGLIERGLAEPQHILALTFTDKAAAEMEERVEALLPISTLDFWISTFHGFGERILKEHALDIGLPNDFRLLSDTEQLLLLREHIEDFDLDYYRPKGNPTKFVQALISHFSRLKDEDITPREYMAYAESLKLDQDLELSSRYAELSIDEQARLDESRRINELASAYMQYQELLRSQHALDFGDLIVETMHLFQQRPALLKKYREQFKYILVDEFQDTNIAQYDLIKLLAAPENNLTIVADDDQAIYSFRGASMSNILHFKRDYPKSTEVSLTQNYRSRQGILDMAYSVITHNNPYRLEETLHINKKLTAQVDEKAIIEHIHAQTLEGEAKLIADKIIELKKNDPTLQWNDFAVLVRANDHAQSVLPYLERMRIPYQFLASSGLFAKPIVLDIIAALKLIDNYHESRAMYRLLISPVWNIPVEDVMAIMRDVSKNTQSLYQACIDIRTISDISESTYTTIERILELIQTLSQSARFQTVGEIVLLFLEKSGYIHWIAGHPEQKTAEFTLYIHQFYSYIEQFERAQTEKSVRNFVKELQMMIDAGEEGRLKPDFDEGPEAVKIMTVHGSKGLEFEYVFIMNLVDKRFPSIGRKEAIPVPDALIKDTLPDGDWHVQEERRLFYVALTRARTGIFLTSAEDYGGARKKKPSIFLGEAGFVDMKPTPTGDTLLSRSTEAPVTQVSAGLTHTPRTFSYSQLKAYETCPWQYRFGFVLKVPVPGKHSFSFGKSIHATLYEFFRRIKEENDLTQGDLFGATKENASSTRTLDELMQIYQEKWIPHWYTSVRQRDEYFAKGKEALKAFYDLHHAHWPQTLFLEKSFQVKVGKHVLKGAIDRVDDTPEGAVIIDYKTGNFPKTGKKEMEQLYVYALALREVFKVEPAKLQYYFLEDNKTITQDVDPEAVEEVSEWVNALAEKILSGNFTATPGMHCKFCDFRDICEFRA